MKCFILFPRDIFEKKKSISNKGGCTMPMTSDLSQSCAEVYPLNLSVGIQGKHSRTSMSRLIVFSPGARAHSHTCPHLKQGSETLSSTTRY